jgi:hypothetical protein
MRHLPPLKAIGHALTSVANYSGMALRFGRFWLPVLFVLGLIDAQLAPPTPAEVETMAIDGTSALVRLLTTAGSLVAICSIAVSWHRFILRDEVGPIFRLDRETWRYALNSILIMVMFLGPVLVLAVIALTLPPAVSILAIPVVLLLGALATRLSIKLPAVALGRKDFSFRDAWAVSEGNFWPIAAVFAISAIAVFVAILVLFSIVSVFERTAPTVGPFVALAVMTVFQVFYTVFNASIFTSLYGFFVERRDF